MIRALGNFCRQAAAKEPPIKPKPMITIFLNMDFLFHESIHFNSSGYRTAEGGWSKPFSAILLPPSCF
jgi:hypothetical protein